jgi:hypothetical protein
LVKEEGVKRTLIIILTLAVLLVALAAPALAFPEQGNAYGNGIKFHCDGASYGQLVKAAQQSGLHGDGWVPAGAKNFAQNALVSHCFSIDG